ncbi:hypothetical protein NEOLEDRAFT_1028671, partial [Neolentinus lepideus HHB14362 ss-1]
ADIRLYTDGSGYKGKVGASAVMLKRNRPPKTLRYCLGTLCEHTVYNGEEVGVMLALELLRKERHLTGTISIGLDNTAVLQALPSHRTRPGYHLLQHI